MKFSILIITQGRKDAISQCLTSIQGIRGVYEIILVENNTRRSLSTMIRLFPTLPLKYHLETRIGIAHARNSAVRHASGDVLIFVDDDCVVSDEWLREVKKSVSDNPMAVAGIGRSLNYYPDNIFAVAEQLLYDDWFSSFYPVDRPAVLLSGNFINTRNFFIRRAIHHRDCMRFNPDAPHKIEDTEYGILLRQRLKSDEQILYVPRAVIYHKNSTDMYQFLLRPFFTGRGRYYLHRTFGIIEPFAPRRKSHKKHSFNIAVLHFLARRSAQLGYGFEYARTRLSAQRELLL